MFKSTLWLIFLVSLSAHTLLAQETIVNCTDSTFCVPSVIGLPRTKGIVLKRELVRDYGIQSEAAPPNGNSSAEVRRNRRWELKIKAPIILKEGFKMAVGFKYFVEEFNFENIRNEEYPFYNSLEDRPLRSIRGDVFMIKPTLGKRYYILRVSAGLNGDYNLDNFGKTDFLKFSISPLVGWKKNDYVSYAVGLAFSYNFGRRTIVPVFAYNKSFNNQWGFESILPAEVKLRYSTLNLKNYFYLKTELNGANYSITVDENREELLFLNKSEVRFLASWEREIHDWLWFSVEGGMRKNINFDLTDSQNSNRNIIVGNNLNEALVLSFSLFIVPPRKLLK
ncbi:hypothetical protein E1176_02080 [Fulvivirga sp. RKSG066]|uniref:DUF6268 family outer membrane beta-barrel protein n=1 Tax=Fulvivirga aurantia TaxID=2529383 RepID=UPI0012BD215F|nr:DUF6268 family outer membrane beta-barrel protein [Fulvivirga aurantia]MTI19801.1 hypothetical protein [Fulvivirga aurantia]